MPKALDPDLDKLFPDERMQEAMSGFADVALKMHLTPGEIVFVCSAFLATPATFMRHLEMKYGFDKKDA